MAFRTVTFLFTDIEGSTRLWDEAPEAMGPALARHDALVRVAIAAQGGETFKTVGDAFCAAFASAPAGAAAALAAQLALAQEPWATPRPIRVRMAVHTGEAEARDDDYFGPPLNRVARLLATGHGGQTLLSCASYELVRDNLPSGASLSSLGEHRLKDLARPETVYGLLHPSLASEFPPLRSLDSDALPNNLPEQTTSFVGREEELRKVAAELQKTRLLTLAGPGGTGKTRLALQAAAEAVDAFPGGVWLVELAALEDPALVAPTVAGVLGVVEEAGKPLVTTLAERLRKAPTLLLLDNCEHLLDAAARFADALAKAVPSLEILATSREPLGVGGETVHRVPTLSLPQREAVHTPESLSHFEAVRLFIDLAVAQKGDFAVTNANAPALASLCLRLDGIPLAIELAAARVRSLTVEQIEARLDDRFRLLTGGLRTALPRQQTLRALVEWSHDLLNEAERAAFRRLAAFARGWTLEAAEAVVAGEDVEEWKVLDLLTSLAGKSLVTVEEAGGAARYAMLETIRQFAGERLREGGEADEAFARHAAFFTALAEEVGPACQGDGGLMRRLGMDLDNLRGANDRGTVEQRLRQAFALRWLWEGRGLFREALERALAALAAAPQDPEALRLGALKAAGQAASGLGEFDRSIALNGEALPLARRSSEPLQLLRVLNKFGTLAYLMGDFPTARERYRECLAIRETAATLLNLALIAQISGDFEEARRLLARGASVNPGWAKTGGLGCSLAHVSQGIGELEEAERLARAAREDALVAESAPDVDMADILIAECLRLRGRVSEAIASLRRILGGSGLEAQSRLECLTGLTRCALDLFNEARWALVELFGMSFKFDRATYLELSARLLAGDRPREAAVLLVAADALRLRQGSVIPPVYAEEHARLVADLRGALGADHDDAHAEGAAMDGEVAKAYALAALGPIG